MGKASKKAILRAPFELRDRLKVAAARKRMTLEKVTEEALEAYLKKEGIHIVRPNSEAA
jgi:predicted DNA-binding protein